MRDTMNEAVSFNRLSWETFCAIYDLSTSKLPHLPVQAIQSRTVKDDRHQSTSPGSGYSLYFLQVTSDQQTCNKISLLGLQPPQCKWLLVIPPYMPPNLVTMRASIRAMLIIYTCLAPFSSWVPSVHGIWMNRWCRRQWTRLRITQTKIS